MRPERRLTKSAIYTSSMHPSFHQETLKAQQYRTRSKQDSMDITYHIDSLQSQVILGMFCSSVMWTLQPDLKFSSVEFYENLRVSLGIWNVVGTAYLGIRIVGYFWGRVEAWWYLPMKFLETVLWIVPVFFTGHQGGVLAKKYILGKQITWKNTECRLTYQILRGFWASWDWNRKFRGSWFARFNFVVDVIVVNAIKSQIVHSSIAIDVPADSTFLINVSRI